jgi:formate-dependent nitrite reductase cytochrome c552 subunit
MGLEKESNWKENLLDLSQRLSLNSDNMRVSGKAWDLLEDRYPETKEQRAFIPQTATSASPVCLQCKSQDHILKQPDIKGRMRKAEFWITNLVDKIVEAKKAGLNAGIIREAQDQHLKAHILWEWWTAENSDGFHNPEMARGSLAGSIDESQKGIKILTEAMAVK